MCCWSMYSSSLHTVIYIYSSIVISVYHFQVFVMVLKYRIYLNHFMLMMPDLAQTQIT